MINLKSMTRLGAVITLLSLATGCASALSIGSPSYACSGIPEGAACQSTRDIYEATHDGHVPLKIENAEEPKNKKGRRGRLAKSNSENGQDESISGIETNGAERDRVVDNYVAPRLPDQPIPVRTPAEVMRIWVAPWEDVNGDLVTNGYIYTEIEPRRWVIGLQSAAEPKSLKPLQTVGGKSKSTNKD